MKKMLTLLSSVALSAVSAFSFTAPQPLDLSELRLTPEGQAIVNKSMAQLERAIVTNEVTPGIMKKTCTIGRTTWDMWIMNENQQWKDLLLKPDNTNPTVEECPYYFVMLYILGEPAQEGYTGPRTNVMQLPLMWPMTCAFDYTLYQENVNVDALDQTPISLDLLANADTKQGYCNKFTLNGSTALSTEQTSDGNYIISSWPVLPPQMLSLVPTYNGTDMVWPQSSSNNGQFVPIPNAQVSTIQFNGFEQAEGNDLSCNAQLRLLPSENSSSVTRVNVNYEGACRVEGFEPFILRDQKMGDMHVVDLGVITSKELDADDPFNEDWTAFHQYYTIWCCEGFTIGVREGVDNFSTQGTFAIYLASEDVDPSTPLTIGYGSLYAPADAKDFNGKYTVAEVFANEELGSADIKPVDYMVTPYGYSPSTCPWSDVQWAYGFQYKDYITILEYNTQVNFGTTKGAQLAGVDAYRNKYDYYYDGELTFYPDRSNMQESVKIDAKGSLAPTNIDEVSVEEIADNNVAFNVVAANGQITVTADEDALVQVYSISGAVVAAKAAKAGQQVNVAVEKGIYVVRVGNQAKKVAL